jgi:hypothetical protein
LVDVEVQEIRRLSADGLLQGEIAEAFGINQPAVSDIVRRNTHPRMKLPARRSGWPTGCGMAALGRAGTSWDAYKTWKHVV